MATTAGAPLKGGLWRRIKSVALTDVSVLVKGIDREALDGVERALLEADFGPASFELVERLEEEAKRGGLKTEVAFRQWLVEEVTGLMETPGGVPPWNPHAGLDGDGPSVVMMLGVNGVGKTTQTAKLAHRFLEQGRSVLLAGTDTFRAGATEQLAVWADRLEVPCVSGATGGDPAAVAFDAVEAAVSRGIDTVLVDTAGRLHTQDDLMTELQKVTRVVGRCRAGAPQESLLVVDGTVGQNALQQGRAFAAAVPVTGLIVTKLDGTAKGGVVIALSRELEVPIRFIGVGEAVGDLEDFTPRRFAERLFR